MRNRLEKRAAPRKRASRRVAWANLAAVVPAMLITIGFVIALTPAVILARTGLAVSLFGSLFLLTAFVMATWQSLGYLIESGTPLSGRPRPEVDEEEVCPRCGDLAPRDERIPLPAGVALCRACLSAAGGDDYVDWLDASRRLEETNAPSPAAFLYLNRIELGLLSVAVLGVAAFLTERAGNQALSGVGAVFAAGVVVGFALLTGLTVLFWLPLRSARVSLESDRIQTYLGRWRTRALRYDDVQGIIDDRCLVFGSRARIIYFSWPEGTHPALRIHFHGAHRRFMITTVRLIVESRRPGRGASDMPAAGSG